MEPDGEDEGMSGRRRCPILRVKTSTCLTGRDPGGRIERRNNGPRESSLSVIKKRGKKSRTRDDHRLRRTLCAITPIPPPPTPPPDTHTPLPPPKQLSRQETPSVMKFNVLRARDHILSVQNCILHALAYFEFCGENFRLLKKKVTSRSYASRLFPHEADENVAKPQQMFNPCGGVGSLGASGDSGYKDKLDASAGLCGVCSHSARMPSVTHFIRTLISALSHASSDLMLWSDTKNEC
ncbi:hypothetical protein Baya_6705 [Bagarius yarrelli]|uniref:Uncharacterized protein n=1 Tax=Bagarius yarrelli TaxID=175774 RepID=A0A556U1L6_BAGYA|nr:hypothetical protein Baya_6705 [Bagarius yarrelli]